MTLEELDTPFERRRVIGYGADGNKVVRHWYDVQNVAGSLYKSRTTQDRHGQAKCGLFIFFPGVEDGLELETARYPDRITVERAVEVIRQGGFDSAQHMIDAFNERVEKDVFIGNAQIEFIRQFDPGAAGRFAQHRAAFYARREEQERQERLARQAEKEAEEARRQAELDSLKALYLGWADGMTPLRFSRVDATLGSLCRDDGKVMTRRDFVIARVRDGWTPQKDEGVTTWYGSRWEPKQSKPKTVYKLAKDNLCYTVSKTEHDFALYLAGHMEVLGG